MKQYLSLREQYPRFAYRGYEIEENESCLRLTYRLRQWDCLSLRRFGCFRRQRGTVTDGQKTGSCRT